MARNLRVRPLRERLLSRAIINWETGCWVWTGNANRGGYGRVSVDGKSRLAHRVAYGLIEGPIPAGLQLDHLCRVRHCINPAHLEPVTQYENQRRSPISMVTTGPAKTQCPAGHDYSPENAYQDARGTRHCRACNRESQRRYKSRNLDAVRTRGREFQRRRRAAAVSKEESSAE